MFQRTPSSIDVRNNHPIDPDWFATLEPGWQEEWRTNFTTLQTGGFTDEDLVMDGWTDITKRIRDKLFESPNPDLTEEGFMQAYYDSDDEKMTEIRARVDEWSTIPPPPKRSNPGTASSASGPASTTSTSRRSTCRAHI